MLEDVREDVRGGVLVIDQECVLVADDECVLVADEECVLVIDQVGMLVADPLGVWRMTCLLVATNASIVPARSSPQNNRRQHYSATTTKMMRLHWDVEGDWRCCCCCCRSWCVGLCPIPAFRDVRVRRFCKGRSVPCLHARCERVCERGCERGYERV